MLMEKSVFTHEYGVLLETLRDFRRRAKITQVELAKKIREGQAFVSKSERGERRLDVIQLREICFALGTTLPKFIEAFEKRLATKKR
jgi:transcriptional regulator with XRE-family HTH domain